jgi:flavin-dependent dehydrogenase
MYDAIVVGSRCAGASTALLLARAGHRVLLVERGAFGTEIPHGHFIHRGGPARLAKWGLLERVLATNCPAVTQQTVDLCGFTLTGRDLQIDGAPLGLGPRRAKFDRLLVDAASEAGVDVRERFSVEDYLIDDGRVVGIRGANGISERATLTIGADGRHSRLARKVNAETYNAHEARTCWYFSYYEGPFEAELGVYARDGVVVLTFPTNDGLHGVFVAWRISEFQRVKTDIEAAFASATAPFPTLHDRMAASRRVDRIYGTADVPNFYRVPHGPGWALVGDAGCHKDPYLALGMADALRDAELLATAATEMLAGHATSLAAYQQARDAASAGDYQENLERAKLLAPPPPAQAMLRSLIGRDDAIRAFMLSRQVIPRPSST